MNIKFRFHTSLVIQINFLILYNSCLCVIAGVPLIDGGTVRLPALIGLSRAMDLILTGRPIKAKEAHDWGLANRVVACGTGKIHKNKLFF